MNKIISENIRTIREMKNMTRDFVAGEMEMTPSGYGKIERGETDITISKISRLSHIFGISISDLLFFDVSYFFTEGREKKLTKDAVFNNLEVRVMKMESDRFRHDIKNQDKKLRTRSF